MHTRARALAACGRVNSRLIPACGWADHARAEALGVYCAVAFWGSPRSLRASLPPAFTGLRLPTFTDDDAPLNLICPFYRAQEFFVIDSLVTLEHHGLVGILAAKNVRQDEYASGPELEKM
ncbi:hypothetical protein B0H13DRAFT_1858631 [Mycena leptocephala]|nr:hypothetical protein B0H13DRAFT_1858631 [Mycena leptocephala]